MDDLPDEAVVAVEGESTARTQPAPSEHSYLPGVSHPLYRLDQRTRRRRRASCSKYMASLSLGGGAEGDGRTEETEEEKDKDNANKDVDEFEEEDLAVGKEASSSNDVDDDVIRSLAVLRLTGVVLFPGSTLPLRLRNPDWRRYLGDRVSRRAWRSEEEEEGGEEEIVIGVMTRSVRDDDVVDDEEDVVGRVGTLAVVTRLHETRSEEEEDDDVDNEHSRRRARDRDTLVVTVVGSGRFRVLSTNLPDDGRHVANTTRWLRHGDMADVFLHTVRVLPETRSEPPSFARLRHDGDGDDDDHYCAATIENLARRTPVPLHVWRRFWPRRSRRRITSLVVAHENLFEGLRGVVENDNDDLLSFSYRVCANLVASEAERTRLLSTDSVAERLRMILDSMETALEKEERRRERRCLHCKTCAAPVCLLGETFTVEGAEGTTGAYVNEYGIVHQTITVKSVITSNMFLHGGPQTKDSWFPGYSWTIAYCSTCTSHLGWKFLPTSSLLSSTTGTPKRRRLFETLLRRQASTDVSADRNHRPDDHDDDDARTQDDDERPRYSEFWGLSGAAVTTVTETTD